MNAFTDTLALDIATGLTLIGLVAASVRLYLGPSRSDRVVALDLITVLLIAIASLAALRFDDAAYLDLGLTLALVGFLATVAFARYVESEPASGEPVPTDGRTPPATVSPSGMPATSGASGASDSTSAPTVQAPETPTAPPARTGGDHATNGRSEP